MKYNGSAWVAVGTPGCSDSIAQGMSIAIDTGGTPYIVYADYSADDAFTGAATVMKFNGSSWAIVGSPGFATPNSYYATIAIDKYGTPYVAFENSAGSASAMKYNGSSWITVGIPGFSAGGIGWTDIVINKNGTPYVAYSDYIYSNNATVMEFAPTTATKNIAAPTPSLTLFPNPTHNTFTLHLTTSQNETATITITNILGEKIKQLTASANENTEILLDAAPGIYFITAVTKDGSANGKITIW